MTKLREKYTLVVIIPHFNNLEGLERSIESIYSKYPTLVLVVDDGSDFTSQPSLERLKELSNENVCIQILPMDLNSGITDALNFGFDFIRRKVACSYIARLDCGDTCVSNRFSLQMDHLEKHPEVFLVGSWVKFVNQNGIVKFKLRPPRTHKSIKRMMNFKCSLIHPSVMFRRSILDYIGNYPSKYEATEDYAFFFKIINNFQVANIPGFLTFCEMNENGISHQKKFKQGLNKIRVISKFGSKRTYYYYLGLIFNSGKLLVPQTVINSTKKTILK